MPHLDSDHWSPAQRNRLERFGVSQSVDIHCHCLPCVDDGPGTLVEALKLCQGLVEDGVTTVVATPHQLGRYHDRNDAASVRQAVAALNRALMTEGVPLFVRPGGDVRLDEHISRLIQQDRILTVADTGAFLLLELPSDTFIDALPLLRRLFDAGVRPILTHPERNRYLTARPGLLEPWLAAGTVLQLTAGSFLGDFGATAQRAAWYWLETGQAALVASDAHNMKERPPRLSKAIDHISRRLGEDVARRTCVENPVRVSEGSDLEQPTRNADALLPPVGRRFSV